MSPIHGQSHATVRAARPVVREGFRVPIAVKYAVATGVLIAAFLIILGHFSYRVAVGRVDVEINDKGIKLATLAATGVDPYWTRRLEGNEERAARDRMQRMLSEFIADQGAAGIIDVVVFHADGLKFAATARKSESVAIAEGDKLASEPAERARVTIRAISVDGEPARSYEKPIMDGDVIKGRVQVYLSAASVEHTREELMKTTVLIVLVAVLLGFVVSVLVGSYLTRPVRVLKKDMLVVAGGDFNHKSQVHTGDELEQLAGAFNRMTAHLAEARNQESARMALERELSIATSIQTGLLPDRIPQVEGYQIFPHYASAKEVGGDYYDFIPLDNSCYGIVVADVSGKGIPGSLVMTMTRSLVRMASRDSNDPAEILARVNYSLSRDMTRGMFVTMVFVVFDPTAGRLRVARAGHNPALLFRMRDSKIMQLKPDGIALGMDRGDLFEKTLKMQEIALEPGDFVALYTDGIVEAMDPNGAEYTTARFAQVLERNAKVSARQMVDGVLQDLQKHTRGTEPSDDITLIVLKRAANGVS